MHTQTTPDAFSRLFSDEESSIKFLFKRRWPKGFRCAYCNWLDPRQLPAKSISCSHCGHPTSITSNTIMHGTKKPLSEWLLCIWWFAVSEQGHSAKDLQRLLKLSSYQTAWTWLQKLRMAMGHADSKKCMGTVEIAMDSISIGGEQTENASIIAAAEIILPAGITGRIKMEMLFDPAGENLYGFLRRNIDSGASLILQSETDFHSLAPKRFIAIHDGDVERGRQIIKSFELWLAKTHRGGVAVKHLQHYLDEFCFRSNAAMLPSKEAVFDLLLNGVIENKSISYKCLTSTGS